MMYSTLGAATRFAAAFLSPPAETNRVVAELAFEAWHKIIFRRLSTFTSRSTRSGRYFLTVGAKLLFSSMIKSNPDAIGVVPPGDSFKGATQCSVHNAALRTTL